MFKKVLIAAAVTAAFASGAQAAATVTNGTLTATIGNNGTFASSTGGYADGSSGLSWGGTEFVNWGTPASWFVFNAGADNTSTWGDASYAFGGSTTVGAGGVAATTYSIGGWSFSQVVLAANDHKLTVTLNITNNTGSDVAGKYSVGFDPDQGIPQSLGFATTNTILATGNASAVSAVAGKYQVTLQNDTSAAATSIFPYIDGPCCGPVGPVGPVYGGGMGLASVGDNSINLIYDLGTIKAGQTASIGYSYVFAAVPEPETYAMLLAGLGAIGFIARRRKLG